MRKKFNLTLSPKQVLNKLISFFNKNEKTEIALLLEEHQKTGNGLKELKDLIGKTLANEEYVETITLKTQPIEFKEHHSPLVYKDKLPASEPTTFLRDAYSEFETELVKYTRLVNLYCEQIQKIMTRYEPRLKKIEKIIKTFDLQEAEIQGEPVLLDLLDALNALKNPTAILKRIEPIYMLGNIELNSNKESTYPTIVATHNPVTQFKTLPVLTKTDVLELARFMLVLLDTVSIERSVFEAVIKLDTELNYTIDNLKGTGITNLAHSISDIIELESNVHRFMLPNHIADNHTLIKTILAWLESTIEN